MKPNPKRFQFMVLRKSTRQSIILNINNIKIRESSSVVLPGLTIDNRLTFKDHINILCRKANLKQLRILATEVFKRLADINPDFMKSYFTIKVIPYCLRNGNTLKIPSARSTHCETNSILFRVCLVWNKLPLSVKQSQSLIAFKSKIKVLKKINCS